MGLLGSLRTGVILAYLRIFLAIEFADLLFRSIDTQAGEVDRVGTHVGNLSVFIQVLRYHHRLTDSKAQFAGSLLLQGTGGEGGSRCTLQRFFADAADGEGCFLALLQQPIYLLVSLQTLGQCGTHLTLRTVGIGDAKDGTDAIVRLAPELLNLTFTLHDEAYGNALHTTSRQGGLHLAP